jgi:hypothetical protein
LVASVFYANAAWATPVLLLFRCLIALLRLSFGGMEWMLLVHWNALSNCFLDVSKILALILITECNCDASLACSARSANAMNIDLGHVG